MLNELAVRQAKARDKDYKLSDSEGLYLFVAKSGVRSWRLKYRFAGKERRLVLGAYPGLSLKEAHERKAEARKQLSEGKDPGIEAKKVPSATVAELPRAALPLVPALARQVSQQLRHLSSALVRRHPLRRGRKCFEIAVSTRREYWFRRRSVRGEGPRRWPQRP